MRQANLRHHRSMYLLMAIACVVAAILMVTNIWHRADAAPTANATETAVQGLSPAEKSDLLAKTPTVTAPFGDQSAIIDPTRLRDVAKAVSGEEIPLPPGVNTAASLDWPAQAESGPIRTDDVRRLLQANAARDWIWYAAHHELTPAERKIVLQISDWSALRGSGFAASLVEHAPRIFENPGSVWAIDFAMSLYPERNGRPPSNPSW